MSPAVLSLAGLFVLAYGAVTIFVLRHRVLGRLALREAVRRKGQSLLIVADQLAASPAVARVTDGGSPGIDLAGSVADLDTRQGASAITLVGFDPGAQEPFGAYLLTTGRRTFGQDLAPGEVLLSRVLASRLDAKTGDHIQVGVNTGPAGAPPVDLRVAGVARAEGPGGYTLSSAVFAPLVTAQRIAGTDLINVVRISAPGGIRDSVAAGH